MLVLVRRQADGYEPWRVEGLTALETHEYGTPSEAFDAVRRASGVKDRMTWTHYRTGLFEYFGTHVPEPRGADRSNEREKG